MPQWRATTLAIPAAVLFAVVPTRSSLQPAPQDRTITVSEGTSMAAAVSPDGSRIAIDLQGTIWMLPRAGGRATRLTDELHDARQPAWSPDGARLAFQSYRSGTWDLWTIQVDGPALTTRAVTTGPFDDREPHWSPDGRLIAFSSDRSGHYDIWTLDVASGAVRRLTTDPGNDYWPAWSPDGREVAFVAERESGAGIRAVTLEGAERLIAASAERLGAPAWTADGASVVTSRLASGRTRLLIGDREISGDEDLHPFRPQLLSSDGLLYTADGRIKVRRPIGNAPETVPFEADLTVRTPQYTPRARRFDDDPARRVLGIVRPGLSPDGGRLVFAALGDIWMSRDGDRPARVTDGLSDHTEPAWSPDGKRLAYASDRHGTFDLFVRDLSTGDEQRVTSGPGAEMRPTWSPDGTQLAYVTVGSLVGGELSVVDVSTRTTRRLLESRIGPINPSWSRDGRTVFISVLRTYSSRYREGVNQVLAVPAGGGPPRAFTLVADVSTGKRGEGPAWSPDGRHVAFVLDGEVHVMPVSASGDPAGPPRVLVAGMTADQVSWTWDSQRVVFSARDRIRVAAIDGGPAREWGLNHTYARAVPRESFVVHAGRLVDGVASTARTDVDIVVTRNRIDRVVPHDSREHGGRVVDAAGLTVLPGLVEGHGHFNPEFGRIFARVHLAYGITTVRSPGGVPYAGVAERETVDAGRRPGPRLFMSGYVIDGGRIYYPLSAPSPTEAAIDRELERARLLEFDLLKTYVRLPDALQRRAVEGAHRIGMPVSSHEIYPAAAFGIDSVEHLAATSRRGYSPKVSLLGRAYQDVLAIVSAAPMTITPTLALGSTRPAVDATPALKSDPRWRLLPAWVREPFDRPAPPSPAAATQTRETLLAHFKAGARIVAGTDSPIVPYGLALHVELEEYVAAGLAPIDALRAATINVARALNVSNDLGTVESGKLADLTIVDGDPLTDIRATRNVRLVIANGVVHRIEDLLAR